MQYMATLVMGILGTFSGKVGTVVGSTNKNGEGIIRAWSKKTRGQASQSQQKQQSRFGRVTGFMSPLNFLIKNSFKRVAGNAMLPFNYACQLALNTVFGNDAQNTVLDYSKVSISDGKLAREKTISATLIGDNVHFEWSDSSAQMRCESNDAVILVVYNVTQGEVSYSDGTFMRSTKSGEVALPYTESGDTLLFYLCFRSATDSELYSAGQWAGSAVID